MPNFFQQGVRDALHAAIRFVMPSVCPRCGRSVEGAALCASCWSQARFVVPPLCLRCGLPFDYDAGGKTWCGACIATPPAFRSARAALAYDDVSRDLILALKHGDRTDLVPLLVPHLLRAGADLLSPASLLVPVPLHPRRLLARRFNQAALLALSLGGATGVPVAPRLLRRRRHTPSQGHLGASARRRNLQGAIALGKYEADLRGIDIVLIDDVMTTGATVEACARVLLKAGAGDVDVLTVARRL